ncbi:DUF2807 domain-containing protein [Brevundimonas sp.]|uniref:GIN domain-containing protein n=1 Tax=Brevundimonas sp. TaxID=1871086 RepID=UPI001A1C4CC4|nr:DUF2807 domain-containing protein [Brevundimonas sp.]MBJ7484856.1 DUF2807 domain-containing protein [Brevundimonas sp.]
MNFAVVATAASIAVLGLVAVAPPASAKEVPEVQVRHAVARMVVIVEDRADVAVEIEGGTAGLPRPTVTRRGDEIRIDGELGRNSTRECHSGSSQARQPGEGASVEVRGKGRVDLSAAPLIVVRTPRQVDVEVQDGAVFGAIGRGANRVGISNGGCGHWTVANVNGPLDVSIMGSGDLRAGTSSDLDANIMGSGNLYAGSTGDLDANIMGSGDMVLGSARGLDANVMGSGDIRLASINGPVNASVPGSGNIIIAAGRASSLSANIMGSGDIDVRGAAGSVSANIMGSGDIRVISASGPISQTTMGSGRVRVGS